jgi:hypothetical protein
MKSARGVGALGPVSVVAQPAKAATTAAWGTKRHGLRELLIPICIIERIVIKGTLSNHLAAIH